MHLPIVVICMLYEQLVWLWSPFPVIVPWVHGPPNSHWSTTVDPMGIDAKTCEASLFVSFLCCLCTNLVWCSSSLSTPTGFLSITGIILCTEWSNSNVARLGKPSPSGVAQICNKAMWMLATKSTHFFNVCLMNLMQALTCWLLWWWYADDTACLMLSPLQNLLIFSEIKLVPASDINLHGILYSTNMNFVVAIRLSVVGCPTGTKVQSSHC